MIAEVSSLPRSRIYDILKNLEHKGFVEIERGRPLKYTVVEPRVIFKKEKEELINRLNETELRLEELYTNEISEIQAPVWLIHSQETIIQKEISVIEKAKKSITIKLGFLLENEGYEMLKTFNKLPRNVKIRIIANPKCYVNNIEINIMEIFENTQLDNLEIIYHELPMIKLLICDENELFGTFAKFSGENNSIIPHTAIGVSNKYEDICSNLNFHFVKQFKQLSKSKRKEMKKKIN